MSCTCRRALVLGLGWFLLLSPVALADEADQNQQRSEPSQTQPFYQPAPSASGDIIGYKPIPSSALETALVVGTPGQASSSTVRSPGLQRTATSQLPPGYLTGVVGEGLYTLGRDDVIRVEVQDQPDFSGEFAVGFDGRIQYNYLGDVPVAGLSKYEVQQVLEKLLDRYIRVPVVNVTIVAYNSKVVYVIGEVNRPGKFIMRGDVIKLREAILAAGLPNTRAAAGRVHVIKPDLNHPQVRVINVKRILYKGKLKDDVDLTAGEIVVVPSTVLSKINDFLASILSPVTHAASVAALAAL